MTKSEFEAPYSKIINAIDYIRIVSEEHLYIAAADHYLAALVKEKATSYNRLPEVIELGCGPGRLLPLLTPIQDIHLTAIDHDEEFIAYAREKIKNLDVHIQLADVTTYHHPKVVKVFCSMGFHHHIPKGKPTQDYLTNIFNQLEAGGYYILGDEFIPTYRTEKEREIALVIWYAHIIAHALKSGYTYLAEEESKTLLDDIYTGRKDNLIKTQQQLVLILSKVEEINRAAEARQIDLASALAQTLIDNINTHRSSTLNNNEALDLSRGDYKICDEIFRKEVTSVGFVVESVKTIGPEHIGHMSVYVLKKP